MHPIDEELIGIGGSDIIAEEASGEAEDVDHMIDDEEEEEQEAEDELLGDSARDDEVDIVVNSDLEEHPEEDDDDDEAKEITIKIKFGGKD